VRGCLLSFSVAFVVSPFSAFAEFVAPDYIARIIDRGVRPVQMDFLPQDSQMIVRMYPLSTVTVFRVEGEPFADMNGFQPISMTDLLQSDTERNPGSFALAMLASLAPAFAETTFASFSEHAQRCLENDGCTVQNMSLVNGSERTYEDIFRLVIHAHSDPTATYGSLTFAGTSIFDATPLIRSAFFVQSEDSVIALVEPRNSAERSFGITGSLVHDVLIFEGFR
jgi:hypothetical protein